MRHLIATTFLTLDGIMQAPGGPEEDPTGHFEHGGWSFHHWDDAMGQVMGETLTAPFDLLLGRRTYDIFAAHWPFMTGDPIGEKFTAVTKYVATSSTEPLTWANSVALRGDVVAEVVRLKQQAGPDLLLQGSSGLIQTLLAHHLIDQFNLLIFPLVLGKGKRLFGTGTVPAGLKLVECRTSTTGVVMCTYRRDGTVKTGSFALETPTEAELARRKRMESEA